MKRRILRKPINYMIIILSIILFIFLVSVDNMELSFIPVYLLLWCLEVLNIHILAKYGDKKFIGE